MRLGITETVLRDGNQSLMATRMKISDFEEILPRMDATGYYSLECWGGATFDSCIRFLNEDPWERLRIIRKLVPKTKLQMLLRGQNLLGYKHYSNEIVRKFIYESVKNGIDIVRIFDALNDIDNIKLAVDETNSNGAHPSCAICYTISPVHTSEKFIELALEYESIGAKSICIKDMSGILSPTAAFDLISSLKSKLKIPVILHSHCTSGFAYMTYIKAIEAGIDVLDTAISAFSGGASQPASEVISDVAESMGRATGLKKENQTAVNSHFVKVADKYKKSGILNIQSLSTIPEIIESQIPGGMYSNMLSQLEEIGCLDKYDEVMDKIPQVRKDLGWPPLVTPLSQMVSNQAVLNVVNGTDYFSVSKEVQAYINGEYGKIPSEISTELAMRKSRVTPKKRFPTWKSVESVYGNIAKNDCDLLTCSLFDSVGQRFLKNRGKENTGKAEIKSASLPEIRVEPCESLNAEIEPDYDSYLDFDFSVNNLTNKTMIFSQLSGSVVKICKREGEAVEKGDVLLICESMKMENEITSPIHGVISKIFVNAGEKVMVKNRLLEICDDVFRTRQRYCQRKKSLASSGR